MTDEKDGQEPSMEEILSSIRRIIADEDEDATSEPAGKARQAASDPSPDAAGDDDDGPTDPPRAAADDDDEDDVLELTNVVASADDDDDDRGYENEDDDESLDEPDEGAFLEEAEDADHDREPWEEPAEDEPATAVERVADEFEEAFTPDPEERPRADAFGEDANEGPADDASEPDDAELTFAEPEPETVAAPTESARSADTDGLLSSAAAAASAGALAKLRRNPAPQTAAPTSSEGALTVEELARELMRPMLKEWIDANLPPMVERLVEREIKRLTEG